MLKSLNDREQIEGAVVVSVLTVRILAEIVSQVSLRRRDEVIDEAFDAATKIYNNLSAEAIQDLVPDVVVKALSNLEQS